MTEPLTSVRVLSDPAESLCLASRMGSLEFESEISLVGSWLEYQGLS